MHAVSTNQIADILHFNNNEYNTANFICQVETLIKRSSKNTSCKKLDEMKNSVQAAV